MPKTPWSHDPTKPSPITQGVSQNGSLFNTELLLTRRDLDKRKSHTQKKSMSTSNRTSRRETARQAAYTFLSNITLGSETDRLHQQSSGNDTTDAQAESNRNASVASRSLEGDTPELSDHPSTGIGTSHQGEINLPILVASKRGQELKVDTSRFDNNALDAALRRQSPRGATEEWSESPLDLRLKDAGNKSLHSVDSSLSDGDIDDSFLSRSGQLSGSASAVLSANESAVTSLLTKQLENRPDAWANNNPISSYNRRNKSEPFDDYDGHHHKLTREDNSKPIASEKIKKKHVEKEQHTGLGILSAFRYYSEKIRQSAIKRRGDNTPNKGYVQQQIANPDSQRGRQAQSFAHFLDPCGSLQPENTVEEQLTPSAYDPFFLDNDKVSADRIKAGGSSHGTNSQLRPADVKRELNEIFRSAHPEIPQEITFSKIRSIKSHLLEVGKELDLEVSSVAHAYVYFEKLVIKAIDDELDIDSEEIREHEFAVFADLEFNLYVPRREFMPHFERICNELEMRSIEAYLGDMNFFAADIQ
ncbi:hypothetical protein Unana1_04414 [Umbelopsis nana]